MASQEGYDNPTIVEEYTSYNHYNNDNDCDKQHGGQRTMEEEPPPVIYIDPAHERVREPSNQNGRTRAVNIEELPPVIYIDQANGKQNTQQTIQTQPPTPNHIEQTIFYDPFEDRRIVLANRSHQNSPRPIRIAPSPPDASRNDQINIQDQTCRTISPIQQNTTSTSPEPFQKLNIADQRLQRPSDLPGVGPEFQRMSPEINRAGVVPSGISRANLAQQQLTAHSPLTPDDGFTLTPLPVTEPPPSYQDAIMATRQGNNGQQYYYNNVITQQPTSGFETTASSQDLLRANDQQPPLTPSRKILNCQHCNTRVATVVVKQNGCATHVIAMIFLFFCLFPVTILIYCLGCLKYENHYCPTCSGMIGYRVPMLGQQLVFVSPR